MVDMIVALSPTAVAVAANRPAAASAPPRLGRVLPPLPEAASQALKADTGGFQRAPDPLPRATRRS